jgi:hypothetical protein
MNISTIKYIDYRARLSLVGLFFCKLVDYYLLLTTVHFSMSKASIPTYRKMKISEINDNVAKACLHRLIIRKEKWVSMSKKIFTKLTYLVVTLELSVTLCQV